MPVFKIHALIQGAALVSLYSDPKTINEWSLKVIEVYMSWYSLFVASNLVVLGWIFGTKIDESVKPMLPPIVVLFCSLNVLATGSTLYVGYATAPAAPNPAFHGLIWWAAGINSIATLGFAIVWGICLRKLRTTAGGPSPASVPPAVDTSQLEAGEPPKKIEGKERARSL